MDLYLSLIKGKLNSLVCSLGRFPFSHSLVYAPLTSIAVWPTHPARFDSSLAWHPMKPDGVSSGLQGHWLHPESLTLITDTFREMLQSIMILFLFFPRIVWFFGFLFPWLKEAPAHSGLRTTWDGTCYILSLLWNKSILGCFWMGFSSFLPLSEAARLCWAVPSGPRNTSEVTGTATSPYVHRPFEVTSKALFAKGLQVQRRQIWPIPSLLFNDSNIISYEQTEAFFLYCWHWSSSLAKGTPATFSDSIYHLP